MQGLRWPWRELKTVRSPCGLHKNRKAAVRFGNWGCRTAAANTSQAICDHDIRCWRKLGWPGIWNALTLSRRYCRVSMTTTSLRNISDANWQNDHDKLPVNKLIMLVLFFLFKYIFTVQNSCSWINLAETKFQYMESALKPSLSKIMRNFR